MRIGIDTNILLLDKAGPAVYTQQLIRNLKAIDMVNEYVYFSYALQSRNNNLFAAKIGNAALDYLWMPVILPRKLKSNKVDVLHCPAFKAPLKCGIPLVVTFYDVHILKSPKDYKPWLAMYCKFMLKKISSAADKIVTISEFSKKDIIDTLSVPEDKVAVTYCGKSDKFQVIADGELKDSIRKKYGLNKKFILYVGAVQPRKNIPTLLRAYSRLKKGAEFDYGLVFVSSSGWNNKDIFLLINSLGITNDVKLLRNISEEDLTVIYNTADFFVYPSFFEGFGMPVLEAMSCGCPVICSNASSLPEVVGGAGLTFNPNDEGALEGLMKDMAGNSALRQSLRNKGIERAKLFSWEKCARETLKIYNEVSLSRN